MTVVRALLVVLAVAGLAPVWGAEMTLQLREQIETAPDSGRYHRLTREESWQPSETALIVCDVWDFHHCLNAVRRVEEFGPRLNEVVAEARRQGITIIHSPSDCMPAYVDHPARKRAMTVPRAPEQPDQIDAWCSMIPSEEQAVYPIDQSDGGEDDDPEEHAVWAAKLAAMGRNPGLPWARQADLITIDEQKDFITDKGSEVWNILEQRGIRNVILTGVHTNMCVLGRPFGLRQMARLGKNVVLMRDMTDTMYNPQRWPYVSHYTGTDLIISHVERFVCPTITSDQFIGGSPFQFSGDDRPHLVMVIAEEGYETDKTLPEFAARYLQRDFRISTVFGSEQDRNQIPGLEVLDDADALLVSVRRRPLPIEDMERLRKFVASGKPVIGIRTASHAFALRSGSPPQGMADWPEFDAEVFGGNYHGDLGASQRATIHVVESAADHPILQGIPTASFALPGSLYETSPLVEGAVPLMSGRVEGGEDEPFAWTFQREDGGRSFYTSMGHPNDFHRPELVRLLLNGIHWAVERPMPIDVSVLSRAADYERHWSPMTVPASWEAGSNGVLRDYDGTAWYRCVVRLPASWVGDSVPTLQLTPGDDDVQAWVNGEKLETVSASDGKTRQFVLPAAHVVLDDANLLVIRVNDIGGDGGLTQTPVLIAGDRKLPLQGRWQFRVGDDPAWSNMPLPAKFGASTDIVFTPTAPQ